MRSTVLSIRTTAAALSLVLAACSPSGKSKGATCTKAPVEATGPGDAQGLFPLESGSIWAYRVTETEAGLPQQTRRTRVSALGPGTVGGATGQVLADATLDLSAERATRTVLSSGPSGVLLLGTDDAEDPFTALVVPYLLLPFPAAAGTVRTPLDCRGLAAGDLDGDGRNDPVDMRVDLAVFDTEPVSVPAGDFDATKVETQLRTTVHFSTGSAITRTDLRHDWFAPGVGLVQSEEETTVDGSTSSRASALYAYAVGGAAVGVSPRLPFAEGQPAAGALGQGEWQTYEAPATPGAPRVAAAVGRSPGIALRWYDGRADLDEWSCGGASASPVAECDVTEGASQVFLDVDAGTTVPDPAPYVVFLAAPPPGAPLENEDLLVPAQAVSAGHVATRGRSTYTATGIVPGSTVTIATAGTTAAADLRVYTDSTRSVQLDCTLMNSSVVPTPEACTFTANASSVYFAVEAGPLNRDGAAYLLLVWAEP